VQGIIILFGAKHIMGHFEGFFKGAETFLTCKKKIIIISHTFKISGTLIGIKSLA
jgi:hypothetical protein